MGVHEECGVFGIMAGKPFDAAAAAYYGLHALQHRGQESCGIVVNDDGVFVSRKALGLVGEVFGSESISGFPRASMAVAHTRYGTTGAASLSNCQPLEIDHRNGRMAIAHNGNISNAAELRSRLELSGAIFHTTSDTEIIGYVVTRERLSAPSIEEAVSRAMGYLKGAYSLIIMSPQKLICARDPFGFRPLCLGRTDDGTWVAASESCAVKAVGARFVRDVGPGEIVVLGKDGIVSRKEHCGKRRSRICVFEYIYFARPDSVLDGVSVHGARVRAGRILARCHPAPADIVIGVPDSGLDAALGYSMESGIPYEMGLIKNKYVGRTFIEPDHRTDRVRIKLSAIEEAVSGKRVVMIDDSIVRGTTCRRITGLLREAGAREVHVRVSAPPFLHPCFYGTDIDSEENLVACRHTVEETAALVGADTLGYLPVESLRELAPGRGCCSACFDGDYPDGVPAGPGKNRFERRLSERTGD